MHQLSISQIISLHPRERLYTHPLVWTARHLGLLSCTFINDGTITAVPLVSLPVLGSPEETPNTDILPTPTTLLTKHPSSPNTALDLDDEWQRYFAYLRSDTHAACILATCSSSISKQRALSHLLGLEPCRYGGKARSVAVSLANVLLIIAFSPLATKFTSDLLAVPSPIYHATPSPTLHHVRS
jgi:hypothetical protein